MAHDSFAGFGFGSVGGYDNLSSEMHAHEARRTRNAVADLLSRPCAESPAIPVRFEGS